MKVDRTEAEAADRKQIGSVNAAVSFYGERINEVKSQPKKTQMEFSDLQKMPPSSRAKELHLAKRDIGLLNENRKVAESVKAQAESELCTARMRVKDLTLRIEESNLKAKAQKCELEKLQKQERSDNGLADNHNQYAQVMKELEFVKQELSMLKLERDSVLEEKMQADKEFEASVSRLKSHSITVETLRREIEETNDEQVLVQLARIEAVKELKAIEAQRGFEASQFSEKLERTRNRIKDITQELDHVKELESKLAITTSDVHVLQNELQLVKAMDQRVEKTEKLDSTTEELDAAKKELERIREEGFQLMASMDIIREELKQVFEESTQLRAIEEKTDLLVQNLNSKLLRAKYKLEAAYSAEDKAKMIVTNLSATLQKLQAETKAANKERKLVSDEAASIRAEIQKTEHENDLAEDMLQAAMKELEAAKASEAIALENLKAITERIMKARRASASKHNSSITISNFEYKYLTSCAEGAKEIADKKVAAAQAWTAALRASEKEILLNTETAKREIGELRLVEEQEVYRIEKSKKVVEREIEEELHNGEQQNEKHPEATNLQIEKAMPRTYSIKDHGRSALTRRAQLRRPSSPGTRLVNRSPTITIKKRMKVMPNLGKFFARKKTKNDL